MADLHKHLRNTFLAGIFAAIPLTVTALVVWYVEKNTRELFHLQTPFLGILLAIAGIYALGLAVSSLIGRVLIRFLDRLLLRIPMLRDLYLAWKHITVTPGGGSEGVFSRVVLIPAENGRMFLLGFSSGKGLEGDSQTCCVFVPAAPNPTSGRLYFVPLSICRFLDLGAEEAFKIILSGGNYVCPQIGAATAGGKPPLT